MLRLVVSGFLVFWAAPAFGQTSTGRHPMRNTPSSSTQQQSADSSSTSSPASSQSSRSSQFGSILGIVADSLHNDPLVEALVTVVQLPRKSVMTSVSGAFRIDSLPPGRYTLEIQHPLIDSLGIRVVSDTVAVVAGETQTTTLSVPPPDRLVAAICTPLQQRLGPAVLIGQVLDADTQQPAVGAEVSIAWIETKASMQEGVRSLPQVRRATVAADGSYRLCGLPSTLTASIQAKLGGAKTGEEGVETTSELLAFKYLRLPSQASQDVATETPSGQTSAAAASPPGSSAATPSTASASAAASPTPPAAASGVAPLQTGHATIIGLVTNSGGVPVSGVRVTVQGGAASTVSGKDGKFILTNAPNGTQVVLARQVGYDPVQVSLDVTTRGPNTVAVQLGDYRTQMAAVSVQTKAPDASLEKTGFPHRKKMGNGHYLTEDDIEHYAPTYTSDLLRHIPGVYVFGSGHNASISSTRGSCVSYVIDNQNISADQNMSLDELVNPADVVGLEFYQVSEVPAQFATGSNSGCAVLIVWTRASLKAPKK